MEPESVSECGTAYQFTRHELRVLRRHAYGDGPVYFGIPKAGQFGRRTPVEGTTVDHLGTRRAIEDQFDRSPTLRSGYLPGDVGDVATAAIGGLLRIKEAQ